MGPTNVEHVNSFLVSNENHKLACFELQMCRIVRTQRPHYFTSSIVVPLVLLLAALLSIRKRHVGMVSLQTIQAQVKLNKHHKVKG